jgi:hypothetical protein
VVYEALDFLGVLLGWGFVLGQLLLGDVGTAILGFEHHLLDLGGLAGLGLDVFGGYAADALYFLYAWD